jgi:hypothetical protein
MTELGRTPWVDRTLKNTWERISEQVPASWMPQLVPGRKFMIEELGCGHYGCVAPVPKEDMVFKITSDVSEARFVIMNLDMHKPEGIPEGIVKYYKIFALSGAEHRKRPLFVLWRQEAKDIGLLYPLSYGSSWSKERFGYDDYHIRNIIEGNRLLELFLRWGREVRDKMDKLLKRSPRKESLEAVWNAFENADPGADPRHYKGIPRIGIALRKCWESAMLLQNTDLVYPIGSALVYYMDEGILLADVHLQNIGRNIENDQLMITDPGHAVEFHPQWAHLPKVPVI